MLHDVGSDSGRPYVITELLEGETPCLWVDCSADGQRFVAACEGARPATGAESARTVEASRTPFDLLVIDSSTGGRRKIDGHGRKIVSVAMSPSGDVTATGDSSGTVRVGRIDDREPHLLTGAGGSVTALAFSPDGRWIASASGSEVRLWPMPDLSKPPLHTLPREALLARLESLTNVRVVADDASLSG